MNTFNRLFVVLGLVSTVLLSVVVLAVMTGLLHPSQLPVGAWLQQGFYLLLAGDVGDRLIKTLVTLALMTGAGGMLWMEGYSARRHHRPILLSTAPGGDVTLSRSSVQRLVEHAASQVDGVLEAKASVRGSTRLTVECHTCVTPESSAPSVAEEVRTRLSRAIEHHVGRPVNRVYVHTQLESVQNRGRRVR